MGKICPGCGGIIGQDCFNPTECLWISEQQLMQQERDAQMAHNLLDRPLSFFDISNAEVEQNVNMFIAKHNDYCTIEHKVTNENQELVKHLLIEFYYHMKDNFNN